MSWKIFGKVVRHLGKFGNPKKQLNLACGVVARSAKTQTLNLEP